MSGAVITKNKALVGMQMDELTALVKSMGQPAYRAQQIFRWIYHHQVVNMEGMLNLSKALRQELLKSINVHPLELIHITGIKSDSTRKFLFQLATGEKVESVLMREKDRTTVCVSSQVGCAVDCKFCATASMGFLKNLTVGEIVDQVLQLQSHSENHITNVVFMGMGEPFLNYNCVISASKLLNEQEGFGLGTRRITISTAGVVPRIRMFSDEKQPYKLAISLNGTSQMQREKIMPITKIHSLSELMDAARYYYEHSHSLLTFEYVLLNGINDSPGDGERLINLIGSLPCKVNVIPYNEFDNAYSRPSNTKIQRFLKALNPAKFTVTVRWSKGTDIDAGCGQLALRNAG